MRSTFTCIDGHTCGNPVRLVTSGGPELVGETMMERRLHFMREYDWIRRGLMYEPRGHDMMSGSILYPPCDPGNDVAILYIETSGCLPMCGHGTIGTVTFMIQEGLIVPKEEGRLRLETPAGLVLVDYKTLSGKVTSVRLTNVPSFMLMQGVEVDCPDLGLLHVDISYGGNFYAIIDPQGAYKGLQDYSAAQLVSWSRIVRERLSQLYDIQHPSDADIKGLTHIMWTGAVIDPGSDGRNAVFYGDRAIDRSPCGTGTSARLAQLHAKGQLAVHTPYRHESIIGSVFVGQIEASTTVGRYEAIIPSIEGWATITGFNTIIIDDEEDPYAHGFVVV